MPVVTFVCWEITLLIALGVSEELKTTFTHLSQVVGQRDRILGWTHAARRPVFRLLGAYHLLARLGGEERSQEAKKLHIYETAAKMSWMPEIPAYPVSDM